MPVPKDYDSRSIERFCEIVNNELKKVGNGVLVCLVYCGRGFNRVGFCIAAYLTKDCNNTLPNSLKKIDESSPRLIYQQKPLDVLFSTFKSGSQIHGPKPECIEKYYKEKDAQQAPIGDIPLPLEKFNTIRKLAKNVKSDDRNEVLNVLAEATNDPKSQAPQGPFPKFKSTMCNNESFDLLRTQPYLMTFEPRGLRIFVVVLAEGRIFIVDPACNVLELKAKANCKAPAVASAFLIEEKKRAVILTTDLFMIDKIRVTGLPLKQRLDHLFHNFTQKLKPESSEQQLALHFIFRPMSKLSNASKLKKDLSTIFVKCDGITFHHCTGEPISYIFLPINPSVILYFDYNGNDKTILYARNENSQDSPLEPVGVYKASNSKFNGLDGRTNRFEIDSDNHMWTPVAIGNNDPPSTIEEVNALLSFLSTNISYDKIFQELDKIDVNSE